MLIKLKRIKISNDFKKTLPRTRKIRDTYKCYRMKKNFGKDIVLDKHNVLIDGYTAYLVAKMVGLKKVEFVRGEKC